MYRICKYVYIWVGELVGLGSAPKLVKSQVFAVIIMHTLTEILQCKSPCLLTSDVRTPK